MDVFVVILQDRHADVEAVPFTTEAAAIRYAEDVLDKMREYIDDDEINDQLTEPWAQSGCLWNYGYGAEGDSIRVMRSELRQA